MKYKGELPSGEYTFAQPVYLLQASRKRGRWRKKWGYSSTPSNWYHWTRVMRCTDKEKRQKIVEGMEYGVGNKKITYSNKNTLYPLAKEVGFDCRKVKKRCTTHCANLLSVALHYAGIKTPSSMHAAKVDDELKKLGGFKFYTAERLLKKSFYLKAGDILQAEKCPHVAVVQNDGYIQRNTLKYGDSIEDVAKWKKFLNWYFGEEIFKLTNKFGDVAKEYTEKFQLAEMGAEAVDGVVGPKTLRAAANAEK